VAVWYSWVPSFLSAATVFLFGCTPILQQNHTWTVICGVLGLSTHRPTRSITSSCRVCHGALLDNRTGATAICLFMAEGCSHRLGVCCLLWAGVCGAVCGCVGGEGQLAGAVTGTSLCIVPQVYICSNRCTWQQHPVSPKSPEVTTFVFSGDSICKGCGCEVCCPLASLPGGGVAETVCVREMLGRHAFCAVLYQQLLNSWQSS
jgi:hypothetical protein